jgi:hypothetical protein
MTAGEFIRTGDRIPDVNLPSAGGGTVPVRAGNRLASVLVTVHEGCADCDAYVERLASRSAEIREWDGRVLVASTRLQPGADPSAVLRRAADPDGILAGARVPTPGVLVADQWGELFAVEAAGADHRFIDAGEVVDWLRYLAIQCPECQGEAL